MITYFDFATFHLGSLKIHTWGFVVSISFAAALWVAYRRARRAGLDGNAVLDLGFWILVGAFLGARLFHVFFYEWGYYQAHLNEIGRIDQGGLSSFGGFIGAAVAFWWYGRWKIWGSRTPSNSPSERGRNKSISSPARGEVRRGGSTALMWRYADLLMFAWPLGHAIGRVGCFLTHMHPGRLSNVPWAVAYPDGARLDMGLIESVVLLSYWVIVFSATKRRTPPLSGGFYVITGMIFYGAARFVLDFFRATDLPMSDVRYIGLTPAQYGSIVLVVGGIIVWQRLHRRADVV